MAKAFENYIFDLYGTLIDLMTNENKPMLWRRLADLYTRFGAVYTAKELRDAFWAYDRKTREKQRERAGTDAPEIQVEPLFLALLREREQIGESPEKGQASRILLPHTAEAEQAFAQVIATLFRQLSTNYIRLFPGTIPALEELAGRGVGLYMLSNAQFGYTMSEIEMLGLTRYFRRIFISSDYGVAKPDPAFLRRLLAEEHIDPATCVMVGNDISSDVLLSYRAGVHCAFLNTGGHNPEAIRLEAHRCGIPEDYLADADILLSGDLRELL